MHGPAAFRRPVVLAMVDEVVARGGGQPGPEAPAPRIDPRQVASLEDVRQHSLHEVRGLLGVRAASSQVGVEREPVGGEELLQGPLALGGRRRPRASYQAPGGRVEVGVPRRAGHVQPAAVRGHRHGMGSVHPRSVRLSPCRFGRPTRPRRGSARARTSRKGLLSVRRTTAPRRQHGSRGSSSIRSRSSRASAAGRGRFGVHDGFGAVMPLRARPPQLRRLFSFRRVGLVGGARLESPGRSVHRCGP